MSMNKPDWTATGVINEIPPSYASGSSDHARTRSPPRKLSVKEEISRKHAALEERDRARAAEYALKEVLGQVKAAKYALSFLITSTSRRLLIELSVHSMRAQPQSPFQFNLFSLSFPTMCLRCLSAPPGLSFGTSVSKDRSWSIDPPNTFQYEALRRWMNNSIRDWRIRRKALGLVRPSEPPSTDGDRDHAPDWSMKDSEADEHEAACMAHLDDAYRAWHNLSDMQKHEKWHSECVTALTQEQDQHRETKDRMERLERQVQSLQGELNMRNSDQPSTSIPLSQQTALQTFDRYTDLAAWDYDKLITKWRKHVQSERAQQHPLPPAPPSPWTASTPDSARSPTYGNGTNPYHRFQQHASRIEHGRSATNGVDEDEHLTDAPGEEDDTEPAAPMERNVLDPNLREKHDERKDTIMANGVSHNGE